MPPSTPVRTQVSPRGHPTPPHHHGPCLHVLLLTSLTCNSQSKHPRSPLSSLSTAASPQLCTQGPLASLTSPTCSPRAFLPRADPPSPLGTEHVPADPRSRFLRAGWSSRMGTGRGQDTRGLAVHIGLLLSGGLGARGSCLALVDSAPAPPQPLTREELPLSGQPAGAAFPPGEMPTEECALHSLTPALIIGIKSASLFHKSRELISCSPFSARGS